MKLPGIYRSEYIKDAARKARLKKFKCVPGLLNELPLAERQYVAKEFSYFLTLDPATWYTTIPQIQHFSYWLQAFGREILKEQINLGLMEGAPGWESGLVRSSISLWTESPNVGTKRVLLDAPSGTGCVYCKQQMGCMVCGEQRMKMKCHLESGGHFCSPHGKLLLEPNEDMMTLMVKLRDGRRYPSLAREEWASLNGIILGKEAGRRFIREEDFGEFDFIPWSPRPLSSIQDPPYTDLLQIRDQLIQERRTECPHTFWDPD